MYKPYDTKLLAPTRSELIRALNDEFRTGQLVSVGSARAGDLLVITGGVADRGSDFIDRAVTAVREFSSFSADNDPYGEHDFGSFNVDGTELCWKIDYYDKELEYGSPDEANPNVTRRVLTILLAREY
jgi:hypothetical protein